MKKQRSLNHGNQIEVISDAFYMFPNIQKREFHMLILPILEVPKTINGEVRFKHRPVKSDISILIMEKNQTLIKKLNRHDFYWLDWHTIRLVRRVLPLLNDENFLMVKYSWRTKAVVHIVKSSDFVRFWRQGV